MSDSCLSKKYCKVEELPPHTGNSNLDENCPYYPSSPESSDNDGYHTDTEANSDMDFV